MTLFKHIGSGAARAVRSWKWILISWFILLVLVTMLVYPLRSALGDIIGRSMITELLKDGLNLDFLANSGTGMGVLRSFFTGGFIMLVLAGILVNTFLSGGFFEVLRRKDISEINKGFFRGTGTNFLSFFVINIIIRIVLNLISFLMIGLPLIAIASSLRSGAGGSLKLLAGLFLLILPVFLLIADYSRAWQAAAARKDPIKALGNGIRQTFRYFFSSYLTMAIILLVEAAFIYISFRFILYAQPVTEAGAFGLFVAAQALFIIKLMLRNWRYGSITAKFEAQS